MGRIGTLVTGAGIQTIINLQYAPQMLYLGDTFTSQPLENLSVSIAGKETININGNLFINSFAEWLMEIVGGGTTIGVVLKIADGQLVNQQTQLRLTNNGVLTPDIFAYSDAIGSGTVAAATSSINANANQIVTDFDFIAIDPTNFQNADVTFSNGYSERFEAEDLQSYFAQTNQSLQGALSGQLVINNIGRAVTSIRMFATGGGNLGYITAKTP